MKALFNLFAVFLALVTFSIAQASGDSNVHFSVERAELSQGGFLLGRVAQEKMDDIEIRFLEHKVPVAEDGRFIIGFGRDFKSPAIIEIETSHDNQVEYPFEIAKREYRIERIDGLPPAKVNPIGKEVLERISAESRAIVKARAVVSSLPFFSKEFILPATGRISGYYGSQRILNGVPKRPHFGQDIAAPVGTPVNAPMSGTVTLAHPDMFYSGATIVIDHGNGLNSTYLHLDSVTVGVGQKVKIGEQIGTIGQSGRATGPHLDWRINWFNQRLDPEYFLDKPND